LELLHVPYTNISITESPILANK